VLAFVAYSHQQTASAWAWWYLAATALSATVAVTSAVVAFGAPIFAKGKSRVSEGFYFSLGIAAKSVYTDMDKVVLLRLGGSEATGVYAAAYKLINIAYLPIQAALGACYTQLFRLGQQGIIGPLAFLRKLCPLFLGYGVLASLGLMLLAPLLPRILGLEFVEAANVLKWLAIVPLLQTVSMPLADALTGAGFQKLRGSVQVGAALLNISANIALIPIFSWRGAAVATLLTEFTLAITFSVITLLMVRRTAERHQ
jgi:O-antigen/teichoic acid export membrane protein